MVNIIKGLVMFCISEAVGEIIKAIIDILTKKK